jgi:hypothetical protein
MAPTPATPPNGSPVAYPTITAGGKQYQLRFAHGAWFQLQAWGFELGNPDKQIPILALAAAAAGEMDARGRWKSAGFARPIDLADAMIDGETLASLDEPVLAALRKAAPAADLTLSQAPANVTTASAPN